ncbi:MAG: conjugal transfer protein TraR [Desulfobacterales bacterium]|nr:conjugal transfer protein TraR [Desulfobacterales bacterium]
MENNQKKEFQARIQARLQKIKADIAAYKQLVRPVSPDNAIGRLTRMEAINSKSINEAALEKAKDTLAGLERALGRIGHPDFDLCRQCEEPIPPARLMALPETDLCVQCAAAISG